MNIRYTAERKNSVMHKLAVVPVLTTVDVTLTEVKFGTTNDLSFCPVARVYVATADVPLRNVKVRLAEFVESLESKPLAATEVGLGPNSVCPAVENW
ncbi:hypothetical protein [Alicyclobacillus fastidiosus]|nr:hypothetical protein [Alicyclobacillus fastidiosus]